MSENQDNKKTIDTEDLKNETKETVNKVKETIKKVDFKEDTKATQSFLKEMFSNPFEAVKNVASEKENVFSKAVVLMIIYIAASVIYQIISLIKYGKYSSFGNNFMDLIGAFIGPVIDVIVLALVVYLFNKDNKKALTTVISTIVVCAVPTIINEFVAIIRILVSGISIITNPITTTLSAVSIILTYFGIKNLCEVSEHKDFIKKYIIIELICALILTVISRVFGF